MRTEAENTAVMHKDGKSASGAGRRIIGSDVPVIIRQMRENETVYAVVTPVRNN